MLPSKPLEPNPLLRASIPHPTSAKQFPPSPQPTSWSVIQHHKQLSTKAPRTSQSWWALHAWPTRSLGFGLPSLDKSFSGRASKTLQHTATWFNKVLPRQHTRLEVLALSTAWWAQPRRRPSAQPQSPQLLSSEQCKTPVPLAFQEVQKENTRTHQKRFHEMFSLSNSFGKYHNSIGSSIGPLSP